MYRASHDRAEDDNSGNARLSRRALLGVAGAAGMAALAGRSVPGVSAQGRTGQPETVPIYPAPETWTASPHTEISFRGVTEEDLGGVVVVGDFSGGHSGVLKAHADGNGVSFIPDARFEPGEVVTVRADIPLGSGPGGTHTFGVARPAMIVPAPSGYDADNPEEPPQEFRSRPDLRPPYMHITRSTGATADGYIFLTTNVPNGQRGLMILDNDGQLIWFSPPRVETEALYDLRVQEYQGQPVLTWSEAASPVGYGFGHFVIADASYTRIADVQVGNGYTGGDVHEFLLTPRGTALVIIYHPIEWDASPIGGSRYASVLDNIVQEVEVETGRVLFEWHSLDHVRIEETYRSLAADRGRSFDYFHMNSVEEVPDGNLIISARHTFAIYKIDRSTNEVIWRLNGTASDFEMGEGAEFAWQHDARIHPNGELTLFDNAESDQERDAFAYSRGVVLELDETAMTATLVREYIHPTRILSTSQANMQVLPNGNVFIGWGSAPVFSEFTFDGELIFNGRFPRGANSYRAYRFPWVGRPADPPDIAVERQLDGTTTVHASWNGATEVAGWQALAGSTPESMEVVSDVVPRSGFETEIPVDASSDWYSAQALDAAGTVIGTAIAVQPDS